MTFRPIQSRSRGSRLNVQVRSFENIDNLELIPAPNVFTPDFEEYVATVNSQGKHVIKKLVTNLSVSIILDFL